MSRPEKKVRTIPIFARILSVVLAVIVVLTAAFSVLAWYTLRTQQVNYRLETLKADARDIAYLAAQSDDSIVPGFIFRTQGKSFSNLSRKTGKVHEEFGAYVVVLDRNGRVMDNLKETYKENPAFIESINQEKLTEAFNRVLAGEEVSVRTDVGGKPTFTVGVPYVRQNLVLGAVLIQTPALSIEGNTDRYLVYALLIALAAAVPAALVVYVSTRAALKPLKEVTGAARALADGDYSVRVRPLLQSPETKELSGAFNQMADRVANNEQSLREFVGNVSHELRSPITSIAGFVEGMRDGTIPPEAHQQYLTVVHDETTRLSRLIGDLLALSRLDRDGVTLNLSEFDIGAMFRSVIVRRMNDLERKKLELDCRFSEDPCMVKADHDRIEQVILNLMDNAIKFTPEGGLITLEAAEEETRVLIRVKDNGIGVPAEDRAKVFDRFFTADRAHTSGKGTGLGLSISQKIVQLHGEQLVLEDTEEGASFAFRLEKGSAAA